MRVEPVSAQELSMPAPSQNWASSTAKNSFEDIMLDVHQIMVDENADIEDQISEMEDEVSALLKDDEQSAELLVEQLAASVPSGSTLSETSEQPAGFNAISGRLEQTSFQGSLSFTSPESCVDADVKLENPETTKVFTSKLPDVEPAPITSSETTSERIPKDDTPTSASTNNRHLSLTPDQTVTGGNHTTSGILLNNANGVEQPLALQQGKAPLLPTPNPAALYDGTAQPSAETAQITAYQLAGNDQYTRAVAELPEMGKVTLQLQKGDSGIVANLSANPENFPMLNTHGNAIHRLISDSLLSTNQQAIPSESSEAFHQQREQQNHQAAYDDFLEVSFSFSEHQSEHQNDDHHDRQKPSSYSSVSGSTDNTSMTNAAGSSDVQYHDTSLVNVRV